MAETTSGAPTMPLDPNAPTYDDERPVPQSSASGLGGKLASFLKDEGAEHLKPVVQALFAQESGSGRNAKTSTDGARGQMQIMPDTFKQIAKRGENIDNPDDNLRVGIRLIKLLGDKFNNDPARIAAGYFSGEGNVNPSGEQVIKRDAADGNGKRVSSYVQDVLDRIASPAQAAEANRPSVVEDLKRARGRGQPVEADLSKLSIFQQDTGKAQTSAADQALVEPKKTTSVGNPVPNREELAVRDTLADASPERLARLAGQGGLPGRIAQTMINEARDLRQGAQGTKRPDIGSDFKDWNELAASAGYGGLTAPEKNAVRQHYFAERIAPTLPTDKQQAAWQQFEQKTRPGVVDRAAAATEDIVHRLTHPLEPDRNEVAMRRMFADHGDEQLSRIAGQGGAAGRVAREMLETRQKEDPIRRFAADKGMQGNKLGRTTPQGIEVLDGSGKLIGHWN